MAYISEKQDLFAATQRLSESSEVAPPPYTSSSKVDITSPQSYDLKSTKTDWVYNGAYSLRVSGTQNDIWNVKLHTFSIEVFRADGSPVGSAGLHCWSTKLDISMNDASNPKSTEPTFTLKRHKHILSDSKRFTIPETGETLVWQRAGKVSPKFELVDEAGAVVAWIGPTSWKGKYMFELLRGGMSESAVEAVVLSALAMSENEKRKTWGATNAAAANSGAAAAAAAAAA